MFDSIAPTELLVVAIVALVVIGPKDLPRAMRFVGQWVAKARGMARHFRAGFDAMMRESELEDLEKQWRAHNQAIMSAYPDVVASVVEPKMAMPPPSPPDSLRTMSEFWKEAPPPSIAIPPPPAELTLS